MSIKASVFIATSLDGYIARANGDLDWLTEAQSASTEQDYGYQEFMDTVDTIVLGRNTPRTRVDVRYLAVQRQEGRRAK